MQCLAGIQNALVSVDRSVELYRRGLLTKSAVERQLQKLERDLDIYLCISPSLYESQHYFEEMKGGSSIVTSTNVRRSEQMQSVRSRRSEPNFPQSTLATVLSKAVPLDFNGARSRDVKVKPRFCSAPAKNYVLARTDSLRAIVENDSAWSVPGVDHTMNTGNDPDTSFETDLDQISPSKVDVANETTVGKDNLKSKYERTEHAVEKKIPVGKVETAVNHIRKSQLRNRDQEGGILKPSLPLNEDCLAKISVQTSCERVQQWIQTRDQLTYSTITGRAECLKDTWRSILKTNAQAGTMVTARAVQDLAQKFVISSDGKSMPITDNATVDSDETAARDSAAALTVSTQATLDEKADENDVTMMQTQAAPESTNDQATADIDEIFAKYLIYMKEYHCSMEEVQSVREEISEIRTQTRRGAVRQIQTRKLAWERATGRKFEMDDGERAGLKVEQQLEEGEIHTTSSKA